MKAPPGKVLKGYMIDDLGPQHCLVDYLGLVFVRGYGGWRQPSALVSGRLVLFPNAVDRGNSSSKDSWSWSGWYERNWLCDSWAWIYMCK